MTPALVKDERSERMHEAFPSAALKKLRQYFQRFSFNTQWNISVIKLVARCIYKKTNCAPEPAWLS